MRSSPPPVPTIAKFDMPGHVTVFALKEPGYYWIFRSTRFYRFHPTKILLAHEYPARLGDLPQDERGFFAGFIEGRGKAQRG